MAAVDLSGLTSALDFSTVVSALLSVFAALLVCAVVYSACLMVLRAVRGDSVRYDSGRSITSSEWDSMSESDKSCSGCSTLEQHQQKFRRYG